eukprot:355233-Chlamydomonas_euryale.AAC.7
MPAPVPPPLAACNAAAAAHPTSTACPAAAHFPCSTARLPLSRHPSQLAHELDALEKAVMQEGGLTEGMRWAEGGSEGREGGSTGKD